MIGVGLPSPAMMPFNRLIRGLLPLRNREPINVNNGDAYYKVLEACQRTYDKGKYIPKDPSVFIAGATVAVQWENGRPWTHGATV